MSGWPNPSRFLEIQLKSRPEEREKVVAGLRQFASEHQLPAHVVQAIDLALEEHLTNLMAYAFPGDPERIIKVRLSAGSEVIVEVEDDGPVFNPLLLPEVDTAIPLEQRPVGGLGVHLMRKFMDHLEYRTQGKLNLLRMQKSLAPKL